MSAEQFQQLLQAITQTAFREGSLKDCPHKFDGSHNHHDIENFITNVSIYIIAEHITESNAISNFDTLLRDKGKRWWNETRSEIQSWTNLISAIRRDFQNGQDHLVEDKSMDIHSDQRNPSTDLQLEDVFSSTTPVTSRNESVNVLEYAEHPHIDSRDNKRYIQTRRGTSEGKVFILRRKTRKVHGKRRSSDKSIKWVSNDPQRNQESTGKDDERRNKQTVLGVINHSNNSRIACIAMLIYLDDIILISGNNAFFHSTKQEQRQHNYKMKLHYYSKFCSLGTSAPNLGGYVAQHHFIFPHNHSNQRAHHTTIIKSHGDGALYQPNILEQFDDTLTCRNPHHTTHIVAI